MLQQRSSCGNTAREQTEAFEVGDNTRWRPSRQRSVRVASGGWRNLRLNSDGAVRFGADWAKREAEKRVMKATKSTSVEELQVVAQFEGLRETLLREEYARHLDKPLAYWALPTDRRLPLALLGRRLRELLEATFGEIAATPGIGRKKMMSLVTLLSRAADTDPNDIPVEPVRAGRNGNGSARSACEAFDGFDPEAVSEVMWNQWQDTVIKHRLGDETLGRLAPSLQPLTRVIWNARLADYTGRSLGEIRTMKTHGEKRVRAVLEIFFGIHQMISGMGTSQHLVVRVSPRLIDQAEQATARMLQAPGIPEPEEIFRDLIEPLLKQVRIDASEQIVGLAERRLGLVGPITSVRQVARKLGLTRARVYQLLNEVNDIMTVRWPTGRRQLYDLRDKLIEEAKNEQAAPELEQFHAALELFYPEKRRGADGPLDSVAPRMAESRVGGNGHVKHPLAV